MDSVTFATASISPSAVVTPTPPVQPSAPVASPAKTIYSDRVASAVSALASGSKASLDDQVDAYRRLTDLICNGAKLYKAGNPDDLKSAIDAYHNSDIAKRIDKVSNQYSARAASGTGGPANSLNAINTFSSDDQKLLFVSLMGDAEYNTVEDWKAGMAQFASNYDENSGKKTTQTITIQMVAQRFGLTDAPSVSGDTVSLSKDAVNALVSGKDETTNTANSAKQALTTLTSEPNTVSAADVALSLLTAAKDSASTSPSQSGQDKVEKPSTADKTSNLANSKAGKSVSLIV
ncbi:hypothetical protein [Asticcacaulis sp. AC466]|uniref:hypothetical protein n=1 Tax=Asticcacaulis sp. AC466 TaxID=1282362 RepID=UPI0012DCAC9F|nr:hypothetical protein [Asticcacaulis sp. AC466]